MIAPDRRFVARLRQRTRAQVKRNAMLLEARKRAPSRSLLQRQFGWNRLRFLVPLIVGVPVIAGVMPEQVLPPLLLWTLCVTTYRIGHVTAALRSPEALWILYQLPVTDEDAFRAQERGVLRSSWWLAADWLAFGLATAVLRDEPMTAVAALLFALAQGSTALGVAVAVAKWCPRWPAGPLLMVFGFGLLFAVRVANEPSGSAAYIGPIIQALEWVTPAGWLVASFHGGVLQQQSAVLFLPISLTIASLAWIHRLRIALRREFRLEAVFDPEASATPSWDADSASESNLFTKQEMAASEIPRSGELEELTLSRRSIDLAGLRESLQGELDQPAGLKWFGRGLVDRAVVRMLTSRQRVLLDFLRPQGLSWTRNWGLSAAGVTLACLFRMAGVTGPIPSLIVLAALAIFGLPLFGGHWLGFSSVAQPSGATGVNSFVPVGFWESARVLLWINFLRSLAAFPLALLAFGFAVMSSPPAFAETFRWSAKVWVATIAIQPLWVTVAYSKNSNDTSSRWWLTLLIVFGSVAVFGVCAIAGTAFFAVDELGGMIALAAILLGTTHGALALYGWIYHRGWFDLIAVEK